MLAKYDLGFLGGGQLARMSIQAAQRMGLSCLSLDPGSDTPASQVANSIEGQLDDPAKIAEVLSRCERVTLENEFIPADAIRHALASSGRKEEVLIPGVETLAVIQDKLLQRQALAAAGVPSPRAVSIEGHGEQAIDEIGFPMVLKARFGGYDGKGTRYAKIREEFDRHSGLWSAGGWLAEEFVPFRRELAVMVATDGRQYAELETVETIQRNHVCDLTYPARLGEFGTADTMGVPSAAIRAVGGIGLFGVEMFELQSGAILVNEIAPRPHNTGHYTLDWGEQSQFDFHVRLVLGLDFGLNPNGQMVAMANLLGREGFDTHQAGIRRLLAKYPQIRPHWYGKRESKPGRKMGHLNIVVESSNSLSPTLSVLTEGRDVFWTP
jgi:5-(carboxyamino)imidazole ribonucleotide synthase